MKVGSLFDLVTDAKDVLAFFEEVGDKDQLISRLERLKRADPEEMLACLDALRMSVSQLLNETLEMNASEPTIEDDDSDLDLGDFGDVLDDSQEDPEKEPEKQ